MADAAAVRKAKKQNPNARVSCHICRCQEPISTAHVHHLKPRAFGGSDDVTNRVFLCASCHTRLHRVQEFVMQGQLTVAYDLCNTIFPTQPELRGALWQLGNEAAHAEQQVKDSFDLHKTHMTVQLSVPVETWENIKRLAKDRKVSAKSFASGILENAVRGKA